MDLNWEAPGFAMLETSAEMTAYAGHWTDHEADGVGEEEASDDA